MFNSNSAWNWWNFVRNIMHECHNPLFYHRSYYRHLFDRSAAIKYVSLLGQPYSKMNFCDIRATVLLQSYVIMRGGRLLKKTKEYVKFLAQKVVTVVWEIYTVVTYERVFETVFDWATKWLFVKWSLTGGGCLREVVAMRELTVLIWKQ